MSHSGPPRAPLEQLIARCEAADEAVTGTLLARMQDVEAAKRTVDLKAAVQELTHALALVLGPPQEDLPEDAAKVLRENLWQLYGDDRPAVLGPQPQETRPPVDLLADVENIWHRWRQSLKDGAFTHSDGLRFLNELRALGHAGSVPPDKESA